MKIRKTFVALAIVNLCLSCKPSSQRSIEIDRENVDSSPIIRDANSASAEDSFENTSTNLYGYSIRLPLDFPDRASLEGDIRLLSLTCDPVVKPESITFETLESDTFVILEVGVSMYGRATKCSSVVVSDIRDVFFEGELNEFIVVPEDTPQVDLQPDSFNEITVQFSQISLPQSHVIEAEIAQEVQAQEEEKQRIEKETKRRKKAKKKLQEKINELKIKETEAKDLEKAKVAEEQRRLQAEKEKEESDIAKLAAEAAAVKAEEAKRAAEREFQRERQRRAAKEAELRAKELLLQQQAEELQKLQDIQEKTVDLILIQNATVTTCPLGQKLDLDTLTCGA